MTWLAVLSWLRRAANYTLATPVWVVCAVAALGASHLLYDKLQLRDAYARGRADVQNAAHFDSTLYTAIAERQKAAASRTDTVLCVVTKQVKRVDSVTVRVPDTVRVRFPVVDTLMVESQGLVVAVDSLTRVVQTERDASALLVSTLRGQLVQSRLEVGREHDARVAAERRPTRWQALGLAALAAGGGFAVGRR